MDDAVSGGIMALEFGEVPDATGLEIAEIAAQVGGSQSRTVTKRLAEMLYAFANEIADGDAILAPDRTRRQVVVGRVTGGYTWNADAATDQHTRTITWNARVGWDELPEPVKRPVLHNQRKVLRFEDQDSAIECVEKAEASGLPAAFAPATRRSGSSAIDARLEGASRNERLCTSCFIIRPLSEYNGDSPTCRVCE